VKYCTEITLKLQYTNIILRFCYISWWTLSICL